MILVNEVKAAIVRNGFTQEEVAKELGMTPKTFSSKLRKGILGSDEIEKLIQLLHIENPMYVFFAKESHEK